ncbi:MAG: hypothetical protein ABFS23_01220 [Pseudomonadota bacterium]
MKSLIIRVAICLGLALVSGCVLKEPYPRDWEAINTVPGSCPDISGIFSDKGQLDPAEIKDGLGNQYWEVSLSRHIFRKQENIGSASHVEIIQKRVDEIKVIAWQGSKLVIEQMFTKTDKDLTCQSGFIEVVGEQTCEAGTGVMACETPEIRLSKNTKGELIMRWNSRGFGMVYLIPATVSEWHWYRFEPLKLDQGGSN